MNIHLQRVLVVAGEALLALIITLLFPKAQYSFIDHYLNHLFLINLPLLSIALYTRMRSLGVLNTFFYGFRVLHQSLSPRARHVVEEEFGTRDTAKISERMKEQYLYSRIPSPYADLFFRPTLFIGLGVFFYIAFFLT